MAGETKLETLLATMSPVLNDEDYVFCCFEQATYGDHARLRPVAAIYEDEGLTLVIPKSIADTQNIQYQAVFKKITLEVHSSLEAVGLTAAFASKLSEHGISANVVAGYYHDHIFVQSKLADQAMVALRDIGS